MANINPTLYTGMKNDLIKRVFQHKNKLVSSFTSKYELNKLVYYEIMEGEWAAIIREKQIKNMSRKDKMAMVREFNPEWKDLYDEIIKQ